MELYLIVIVFLQVILFKLFSLNIRKLQDLGASSYGIMSQQRYAIYPAVILFVFAFDKIDAKKILNTPQLLFYLIGIALLWLIVQFSSYLILNSANSLSLARVLSGVISLPILATVGIFINKDLPNSLSLAALIMLGLAIVLKPNTHKQNGGAELRYSIGVIFGIILVRTLSLSLDTSFYRNFLLALEPYVLFGISIYIVIAAVLLNIIYLIKPISEVDKNIIKRHKSFAIAIPLFWFMASIPEGYSYANFPIFVLASLSSVSFLIDMLSDLRNNRISLQPKTILFATLVLASILLSSMSVA